MIKPFLIRLYNLINFTNDCLALSKVNEMEFSPQAIRGRDSRQ